MKISNIQTRSQVMAVQDTVGDRVVFSFASDYPVDRGWGYEILELTPQSVNLDRVRRGACPWLLNHDKNCFLGTIRDAWVTGNRGYCEAEWSESSKKEGTKAWEIRQEVEAGKMPNVSFTYAIAEGGMQAIDSKRYLVKNMEVLEISTVTIPADPTVGFRSFESREISLPSISVEVEINVGGESGEDDDTGEECDELCEDCKERGTCQKKAMGLGVYKSTMMGEVTGGLTEMEVMETRGDELTRIRAITALCNNNGLPDMAEDFINQGTTLENARAIVEKATRGQQKPLGGSQPVDFVSGLEGRELQRYSLIKAMRSMLPEFPEYQEGGLEREVSRTICNQLNGNPERVYIPTRQLEIQRRDTLSTQGQPSIIATELRPDMWIEALRNACLTLGLGARFITGLKGTLTFPKETGVITAGWVNEGGDAPESDFSTTLIEMSPKTVASYTVITRRLLMQSTPDAEMIARNNLLQSIAQLIDQTALYGTGIGPTPLGVANTSGIKLLTGGFGTDGGYPTYAGLVTLMGEIDATNINTANLKWLINSKTRARLMITPVQPNGVEGNFILNNDSSSLIGFPFYVSNQVRSNLTKGNGTALSEAFLADWSKLYVGEWSGLSLSANTQGRTFRNGGVEYVAFQDLDMVVAQTEAFGYLSDIKTA